MADSRTIGALRKQNVAKASFHADGSLASVEFWPPPPEHRAEAKALAQPEQRQKLVPGTPIPDDKSPLNPLDTLLNVPRWSADEVDA